MEEFIIENAPKLSVAGWQHAGQSDQNGRAPQSAREKQTAQTRANGERGHVAGLS